MRPLPNLLLSALVLASTASAQNEWGTFPVSTPDAGPPAAARPPPPPAPVPAAVVTPAPVAAPAPTPTRKLSDNDDAKARAQERVDRAQGKAPPATASAALDGGVEQFPIVMKKEEYLAGTEPHSPATYSNSLDSPSNGRVSVGSVGIGVFNKLSSARLGAAGVVRVSVLGEYLSQGDFPVKNAQNIRSAGTFAVSFQPFTWGEVFVAYGATANTNNRTSPNLIQALGDLTFGVKASYPFAKGFWAGADLRLLTFSGVGNQSVDRFAVGFQPRVLAAWDVRAIAPKVPIIAHANLGFSLDSTGGLLQTSKPNASEEFALGINRFNRFTFGLGLEIPLPFVTPTIEYSFGLPLGVANGQLDSPDGTKIDVGSAMPQNLGLGLKITALKDLTLLFGANIGLSRSVGLGVPATPPWNLLFGASFAIDPFQRGETKLVQTVRERTVEKKVAEAPKTSRLAGTVADAKTKAALNGVVLSVEGTGFAVASVGGKFTSQELPVGPVKVKVVKDGYKEVTRDFTLEANKPLTVALELETEAKKATFDLTVTSKKKPVTASVSFLTPGQPTAQAASTSEALKDPVKVEVNAGNFTVNVSADGYLSQTRDVQIAPGGTMALAFDLVPAPKKSLVIFKDDKIEILQQVHFATGKATILQDSFPLLQQVVDAVVRNNVKRIRIEGHTDNRGDKAANQKLSEDRARAVADFMIEQGIDKARVDSAGFGDSKPAAPNLTARGREINRRVEFIISER